MNVRIELVCTGADGTEQRRDVMELERAALAMETLGMNLNEGKAVLEGLQKLVVSQQVNEYLEQHRNCPCGKRRTSKDAGSTPVKTVFGQIAVPSPRWNRCACEGKGPKTFRPIKAWLQGRTSPELV